MTRPIATLLAYTFDGLTREQRVEPSGTVWALLGDWQMVGPFGGDPPTPPPWPRGSWS